MHLTVLVIRGRILLKSLCHHLVIDHHLPTLRSRLLKQVKDIQQLTGIPAGKPEKRRRRLHPHPMAPEHLILLQCPVEQLLQLILLHGTKRIHLRARQQRPYHLKRRILRSRAHQRHYPALHSTEQTILLRLVEAVYFINKQYRPPLREHALRVAPAPVQHIAHLLHPRRHSRERIERHLHRIGYNLGQRGLPHPGRTPEYERRHAPRLYHPANNPAGTYKMSLAYIIIKRTRTQTLRKWWIHHDCKFTKNVSTALPYPLYINIICVGSVKGF